MKVINYKIRRKSDGLFSSGGERPTFGNKGKLWKTLGHLHSHLVQIHSNIYDNAEIVPFVIDITEDNENCADLKERMEERRLLREKKDEEHRKSFLQYQVNDYAKKLKEVEEKLKKYG